MKRFGNLFPKIYDYDNLKLAHRKARKDKSFYREVKMVNANEDYYIKEIQRMLMDKTYIIKHEDYQMFKKMDKGKEREIFKLDYFPHRIIQHALMNVIEPILLKTFISSTYASIPNRGIHAALKKMDYALRHDEINTKYCLKMDVKKFYPSINQNICKQLFRRKFKDNDLLWLMDTIIDSMPGDKGIAIGSLFSQWAGNYYLTQFDHWIKEVKHMKYYYRYCDDLVILHGDKTFLHNLEREINKYFTDKLDLQVKGNWQVFPVDVRGIDFVGYRHFRKYILLRKTTAVSLKRKMVAVKKKMECGCRINYSEWCSINSYDGWLKWCNSYHIKKKYIAPLKGISDQYYLANIKSQH